MVRTPFRLVQSKGARVNRITTVRVDRVEKGKVGRTDGHGGQSHQLAHGRRRHTTLHIQTHNKRTRTKVHHEHAADKYAGTNVRERHVGHGTKRDRVENFGLQQLQHTGQGHDHHDGR
jgi:hypothetical protein